MKKRLYLGLVAFNALILIQCKTEKKETSIKEQEKPNVSRIFEEGEIEAYEESLWSVIPEASMIEVLAAGHDWTEGPLWLPEQEMLLYTDIPRNAIYSWKEGEEAKMYLKPSGFMGENFEGSEPGANGLLLNSEGELVLCQHGERQIALMQSSLVEPAANYTTLASAYKGKRFNSPNDAAYKSNGDLYFTDPPYGLPKRMEDPDKELDYQGVYRLSKEGELTLLTTEFTRPNGIAFSPDEKKLYVANSDPELAIWKVFDVLEDGSIRNGRTFYDATGMVAQEKGLPDGLKVDNEGNIFATGPGGVFIFSPEGRVLGKIKTGQATSNCAFNADKSTLYITADSYVLRVRLRL
ncbi:SMP-30/gluconolactonase/LRE family protein [Eudoraea adriatica]|uniref:SMP-30/gluconolactonase/LRE family protein n=1 Tax=Eudoraea adriatica TaxID=446681 RepID=UPI00037E4B84|nr:SMP-30/gluconolactonase/LRE family protein [Eudoraea adriatica]